MGPDMSTPAAGMGGATPPQPPPQAPQNAPAPPNDQTVAVPASVVPHVSKMASIGSAFHKIASGTSTQWQQTPQGPVPVQVPNKPGQLFRSILAGALAGMGAGAENADSRSAGSGWAAAGRGAAAAGQQRQQADQRAQQQAQQQFENQQKANQAASEETLRKAQISMYNMEKLKDLHAIQAGDYTSHRELVNDAKPVVDAYNASGLTPVVSNVSETDHENYLKTHPGSSALDWQPTGMTSYVDSDGRINYQTQWSAYDPKGNITLPASTIKDWKDSGLLDMNPNLLSNLKKDANGQYQIPYSAMTTLSSQNNQLKQQAKDKQANDYQAKEQKATLEHLAAQVQAEKAAAAASGDEAALRTFELKQERATTDAQTALTKAGGDWSKLTPEQKVALQPQVQKDIDGYRTELNDPVLKEQLNDIEHPDVQKAAQDRAAELHTQLDEARKHSIYVAPTTATASSGATPNPKILSALQGVPGINTTAATQVASMTPQQIKSYLPTANLPAAVKTALYHAIGEKPPSTVALNPMGQAVAGAVRQTVPAIVNAIP